MKLDACALNLLSGALVTTYTNTNGNMYVPKKLSRLICMVQGDGRIECE